jgi:iron complex outermembrane receptor protein
LKVATTSQHQGQRRISPILTGGLRLYEVLLAVSLSGPTLAIAQVSQALPDIVVSARRRDEKEQDVPIPISVLTGETLEASGRFRVENLNQLIPSLNIQYNGPRQTSFTLRGLGNSPANDALESSMGIYLDNVYLGRASMANLDLIDIDEITLLRGSQGTLFGKNTTAGVLSIATRAPSFVQTGGAEASLGDYEYNQVRAVWSQSLLDNSVAARFSFAETSQDGFVTDTTTGRKLNGSDRIGGRGQLLWRHGDGFNLRVIGDYSAEHSDAGAFILYSAGPNRGSKYYAAVATADARVVYSPGYDAVTIDGRQHFDVRQGGGSAEANWQLGGYRLTSITAYRRWWFMPYSDGDYTDRDAIRTAGQAVDDHQWTQEFRLASPSYRRLGYVVGLFYLDQYQDNLLYTQYGNDVTAITALGLGNASYADGNVHTAQSLSSHTESAFGQATWKPQDSWELAVGMRDTDEQKSVNLERTPSGLPGFVTNPNFIAYGSGRLIRDDNNVSGMLSVSHTFDGGNLAYASIARGAKSGGINPTAPVPGLTVKSLYFNPEFTNDLELGVKATLLGGRLHVDSNLFWIRIQDYQATFLLQPVGGNTFSQILSNVGDVRTRGVETELATTIGALSATIAASLNDATYLNYHNAPCSAEQLAPSLSPAQKVCDLTGRPLAGAPRWIMNPSLTYAHAAFDDLKWTARIEYSWRSALFGSADDSSFAEVPSYGILNLRWSIGRRGAKSWTGSLWANNLFDKRYVLGGLSVAGPLYNYIATPGAPRTMGATLRLDF